MTLAQYLAEHRISGNQFARQAGCHQSTIARLLAGDQLPRIDTAQRIKIATMGAVDFSDWRALETGDGA